jgi:hypothetical protein
MKTKLLSAARTIKVLILLVFLSLFTISLAADNRAYAEEPICDASTAGRICPPTKGVNCKGGINQCNDAYVSQCVQKTDCDIVVKYVNPMIRFLILLVGIAVVIGIIKGGIQYMLSTGEPQKAAKAKESIRNAIIALLFYIFLYAMLRFLMPGDYLIV